VRVEARSRVEEGKSMLDALRHKGIRDFPVNALREAVIDSKLRVAGSETGPSGWTYPVLDVSPVSVFGRAHFKTGHRDCERPETEHCQTPF
jgi:hypothetical protein